MFPFTVPPTQGIYEKTQARLDAMHICHDTHPYQRWTLYLAYQPIIVKEHGKETKYLLTIKFVCNKGKLIEGPYLIKEKIY